MFAFFSEISMLGIPSNLPMKSRFCCSKCMIFLLVLFGPLNRGLLF